MKEKWGLEVKPQKIFGATHFQSKENTLFDIKIALQKGHFCSLGPDP